MIVNLVQSSLLFFLFFFHHLDHSCLWRRHRDLFNHCVDASGSCTDIISFFKQIVIRFCQDFRIARCIWNTADGLFLVQAVAVYLLDNVQLVPDRYQNEISKLTA